MFFSGLILKFVNLKFWLPRVIKDFIHSFRFSDNRNQETDCLEETPGISYVYAGTDKNKYISIWKTWKHERCEHNKYVKVLLNEAKRLRTKMDKLHWNTLKYSFFLE